MGIKDIADILHEKGYNVSQSALLRLDDLGRDNDAELTKEFLGYLENRRKNIADVDVMNFEHFRTAPNNPRNQERLKGLAVVKSTDKPSVKKPEGPTPNSFWSEKRIKKWIEDNKIPIKYDIKRETKKEKLNELRGTGYI